MSETKIKKLNLKALQVSQKQGIKEDITSLSSKPTPVLNSGYERTTSNSDDYTKEKKSPKKISIANIKKNPIKKSLKKEEKNGNTNNTLHSIKEDEEKNITELSKTHSSEKEESKNNNTSVIQGIKKEVLPLPPKDSDKNSLQETNITAIDTNKQKNNINENFKEEVLSENEQQEIIEKTLKKEKIEKKGVFSKIFSSKKKTHTSQKEPFNKIKKESKEIHFENYTSDFEKKSKNILKKVQNFKYTPQTRKGLIIGLISLTFVIIGGLTLLFPEKHSFKIYKASILEMTHEKNEDSSDTDNNIPFSIPQPNQDEIINQSTPIEELSKTNKIHAIQEKENKEKLRNYLLNKYKK